MRIPARVAWSLALAILAALLITGAARPALAGELEARSLFAEGRRLRLDGKCEQAIPLFRKAIETYPDGLGALRNTAECEVELGRFASARRSYWDLRLAVMQSSESKYEGWVEDAETAHRELDARVPRVQIELTSDAPSDLELKLNGRPLDPRLIGVEIEVDLGPQRFEASRGGGTPVVEDVDLAEGERRTIRLELPEPASAPERGWDPERTPPARDGTPMRVGALVAFGVGGLAAIATGVSIGVRQGALSEIDDACPTRTGCPQSLEGAHDRGVTASTLVNVFAITAVVGVAAGVTLWMLAPEDDPTETASRPHVTLEVAPLAGGGGLGLRGAF